MTGPVNRRPMHAMLSPEQNFSWHIAGNRYPGRGLIIGRTAEDDAWLVVYWIMGRSERSRNRRFMVDGPELRTLPADHSRLDKPDLIIYPAMLELPGIYIVANGDQSLTIRDALTRGGTFEAALATREREPDAPNYTPRISGMLDLTGMPAVSLSVLSANPDDPTHTDRATYAPTPPPAGLGLCLTTYMGDGDPLPGFTGDPLVMPLRGGAEEVMKTYWNALDRENRIAIAVKRVARGGGSELMVINRF
ncbi:MAG: inosine monophosphate cyclohydrolase [Gemmatimonadetes bacterium]|nr:inosine monophosphate cyclohydrolase [Gemmatimonadota bacterium]